MHVGFRMFNQVFEDHTEHFVSTIEFRYQPPQAQKHHEINKHQSVVNIQFY